MITTTNELLQLAEETSSAIAAFNCYNAETVQAAISAGEKANQGIIKQLKTKPTGKIGENHCIRSMKLNLPM